MASQHISLSCWLSTASKEQREIKVERRNPLSPINRGAGGLGSANVNHHRPLLKDEQTFVWKKKIEKEGLSLNSLTPKDLRKIQKRTIRANQVEFEKVKRRREEREIQQEINRNLAEQERRKNESELYKSWGDDEDTFFLKQVELRSKLRLENNRAKPIDHLARYVKTLFCDRNQECTDSCEIMEPDCFIKDLCLHDMEDVIEDIKVYKKVHRDQVSFQIFWDTISERVKFFLRQLSKKSSDSCETERHRHRTHPSILKDTFAILTGKSYGQLSLLKQSIEQKLQRDEVVDVEYWHELVENIEAFMAKLNLDKYHKNYMSIVMRQIKLPTQISTDVAVGTQSGQSNHYKEEKKNIYEEETFIYPGRDSDEEDTLVQVRVPLLDEHSMGGVLILTSDEDKTRLDKARQQVLQRCSQSVEATQDELDKVFDTGEAEFSCEVDLKQQDCYETRMMLEKYQPQKPKYFNKLQAGYAWNQYNRTHYDIDNPPPKTVIGYKFNIFYPDLMDKTEVPRYSLTPCAEDPDLQILRFTAGPPYEDVAFKIVKNDWDKSRKSQYRCWFHRGVLQLWFHFKRQCYRR